MPSKKKAEMSAAESIVVQNFKAALAELSVALKAMQGGDFVTARQGFEKIASTYTDETTLVERARMYALHCTNKLAPAAEEPQSADDLYYSAVIHSNNGEADTALGMLDRALLLEPESARLLYARASAAAIKSDADTAVQDLRRAIAVDPRVRFQAANDPDFEAIREEPAFIDIIEPTPAGA